jgi:hypothetical protein
VIIIYGYQPQLLGEYHPGTVRIGIGHDPKAGVHIPFSIIERDLFKELFAIGPSSD